MNAIESQKPAVFHSGIERTLSGLAGTFGLVRGFLLHPTADIIGEAQERHEARLDLEQAFDPANRGSESVSRLASARAHMHWSLWARNAKASGRPYSLAADISSTEVDQNLGLSKEVLEKWQADNEPALAAEKAARDKEDLKKARKFYDTAKSIAATRPGDALDFLSESRRYVEGALGLKLSGYFVSEEHGGYKGTPGLQKELSEAIGVSVDDYVSTAKTAITHRREKFASEIRQSLTM